MGRGIRWGLPTRTNFHSPTSRRPQGAEVSGLPKAGAGAHEEALVVGVGVAQRAVGRGGGERGGDGEDVRAQGRGGVDGSHGQAPMVVRIQDPSRPVTRGHTQSYAVVCSHTQSHPITSTWTHGFWPWLRNQGKFPIMPSHAVTPSRSIGAWTQRAAAEGDQRML